MSSSPVAERAQVGHAPLVIELARTQERARRHEARVVIALTAAVICVVIALGQLLAAWVGAIPVAHLLRWVILAVAACGGMSFVRRWPARFFVSRTVPELLALYADGEHSSVLSAAEFLRRPAANASQGLVAAHLQSTAAQVTPVFAADRLKQHFRPLDQRASGALAASVVLLGLAVLSAPTQMRSLLNGLFSLSDAELSSLPLVGDVALTLRPPAYTGLSPRQLKGGDGTVRALKGTQVVFHAITEKSVRGAELDIGEGASQRVIPLAVRNGREVDGEFAVMQTERYRVVLKPLLGTASKERFGHPIYAEDDKAPGVELRQPAQDLELKESARLSLQYSASDDFAVAELAVTYKVNAGMPQRMTIGLPESRQRFRGDYMFDLAPLALKAGDVVSLQLEAKDNNNVSGPGVGLSAMRRVTIFSADAHRRDLLARLRDMTDRFTDMLADELENPMGAEAKAYAQRALPADERGLTLASDLLQLAAGLKETDGHAKVQFSVATERSGKEMLTTYERKRAVDQVLLQGGSAERAGKVRDEAIALIERTLIYFEDLRGLATIEELKSQAQDLAKTGAELSDLLKKYRETGDENLRAALDSQIRDLKQKLDDIRAKMADLRKNLPEGYNNAEAFERKSMDNTIDKLQELLAQNKYDELQKELEHLQNQLENMQKRIDKAQDEYGGERYAELRQKIESFRQNFDAVEQAEKQALQDTEKAESQYREEVQRRMGENLDQLVKQTVQDLEAAQTQLNQPARLPDDTREGELRQRATQRLGDTRQAMTAKDLLEARDMLALGEKDLQELQRQLQAEQALERYTLGNTRKDAPERRKSADKASQLVGQALERLNKLFPDPREVLSPKQMQQLTDLQKRQQQISQKTKQLGTQMKDINQQAPMFDPSAMQQMSGAGEAMDRAAQELQQSQAGKATQGEHAALDQMQKLREMMKGKQGQGDGEGIPQPFGGLPDPMGEGGNQQSDQKVEIPSGESFKVPPEFRRDILDAMKQGSPEQFKKQVEQFYRELIK